MTSSANSAARVTALALGATVITQLVYIGVSSAGIEPNRPVIWGLEALLFSAIALGGLVLLPARPIVGAGLALGGVLNVIQVGIGLVMFGPLIEAGEALTVVTQAVVALAFFLYFTGKFALGVAAISLGVAMWRASSSAAKWLGVAAVLAGLTAFALNGAAMVIGMEPLMFPAGAAGTAAALLLAILLWLASPKVSG